MHKLWSTRPANGVECWAFLLYASRISKVICPNEPTARVSLCFESSLEWKGTCITPQAKHFLSTMFAKKHPARPHKGTHKSTRFPLFWGGQTHILKWNGQSHHPCDLYVVVADGNEWAAQAQAKGRSSSIFGERHGISSRCYVFISTTNSDSNGNWDGVLPILQLAVLHNLEAYIYNICRGFEKQAHLSKAPRREGRRGFNQ